MRAISRRNRGKEVKKSFEHFLFLTVPLLAKESWASGKMNSVCECNIKKPSFLRPIERVHFFIPFDPQLRADTYNSIQLSLSQVSSQWGEFTVWSTELSNKSENGDTL